MVSMGRSGERAYMRFSGDRTRGEYLGLNLSFVGEINPLLDVKAGVYWTFLYGVNKGGLRGEKKGFFFRIGFWKFDQFTWRIWSRVLWSLLSKALIFILLFTLSPI
jgi:hypothetical protein